MLFTLGALKISQISLEKYMCFSRKLHTLRPENLSKRDSNTGIFL